MKKYFLILTCLISLNIQAQQETEPAIPEKAKEYMAFKKNSYTATLAFGFINTYRSSYTVPNGFEKGSSTSFTPVYGRLEYAVSNSVSIGLNTMFNTIHFNSMQLYQSHSGEVKRTVPNKFRLFGAGLVAYKHFGHLLRTARLDPFIGLGISLNNIYYSALPQGDSTIEQRQHTTTPFLKAGVRYYVSDKISAYVDAGYDKLSYISIGFSCRFSGTIKNTAASVE